MMKIGYDLYSIEKEYCFDLLKFVKVKKIKLLHLRYQDDMCYFYIPTYQRFLIQSFEYTLYYQKAIGLMKYVLFLS